MSYREHGYDSVTERLLLSLDIPSVTAISKFTMPSGHFVCLLACDARNTTVIEISAFVATLLHAGASYFVCWGPDCERVHDIIDEMLACSGSLYGVPEDSVIMTTWHASEPLSEALFYFLVCSWPDEHYQDSTRTALAISVGSASWAAEIVEALDRPIEYVRRLCDEDAG